MDARFSDFHSTSVSTSVPFQDTTTCGSGITKDAVWRTQEKKKGRSGTRRTRERNAEIIRIQFTCEFHAGLLLCPTFAVEVPDLIGKKKMQIDVDDQGQRKADRSRKNGAGMEDEWRWKESGWENGPYNWCSSWKAAENKGGRENCRARNSPMKLRFHLQIKIHVVRSADGKNSTRLLVPSPRRAETSSFHRFTFFYIHPAALQLSRLFKLTQLTW